MNFLVVTVAPALIWIFVTGRETTYLAYPIYILSAYTLTVFCVAPPRWIKARQKKAQSPKKQANKSLDFKISLYSQELINFLYGITKLVSGVTRASVWIGADGLYNFTQALIQLFLILHRRKNPTLLKQWKTYRFCGWLMLLLNLTITGLVFQMSHMGRFEEYPGYLIFLTAMFAFHKLIKTFWSVAKDRKHAAPIDSAVRLLDLSQALFSMFSLQVAMIHQFGGTEEFANLMNNLTGTAVCLMVVGIGIYMLYRSNKAFRQMNQ